MKKIMLILGTLALFASCGNEPKLNKQEEQAVEDKIAADQRSMDSLEAAIQAQMDAINADSTEMDSI